MQFSDRQKNVALFGQRDGIYLLAVGPAQCGKTEAAAAGFLHWATRCFTGHKFAIIAKTQSYMDNTVLDRVKSWCWRNDLELERAPNTRATWQIKSALGGYNSFIEVIAADGEDAAKKRLKSHSLSGAFVDELTEMPPGVLEYLETRLFAEPNAKVFGTTNPEGPDHPVKLEYVDKIVSGAKSGEVHNFKMSDRPGITQEDIDRLAASFSSTFYKRMVLGEWAAASGLVFPVYPKNLAGSDECPPILGPPNRHEVSIDWGRSSVTTAVLVSYYSNQWRVSGEWSWNGDEQGPLESGEQARLMYEWATALVGSVATWIAPWDAHGIAEWLGKNATGDVVLAYQLHDPGVDFTNKLIEGKYDMQVVFDDCPDLRKDLSLLKWSKKMNEKNKYVMDKASAGGAHFADAFRGWAATYEAVRRGIDYRKDLV